MHGLLEKFKRGLMADAGQGDDEARQLRERMMLDTLRVTDAVPLGGQQVLRRTLWPALLME